MSAGTEKTARGQADSLRTDGGRRGRPQAQATGARKARLIAVARAIFVRRGYRATTMDEVAAAAGVTKRTLYAWHRDKQALFQACVMLGAERFPRIAPEGAGDVTVALETYVIALHNELVREDSYGMGALFMREAGDFPELADAIQRGHHDYLISPLSAFLRQHGLEEDGSVERTQLFVAMALSPLHNAMLVGMALPDAAGVRAHAQRCVAIFAG